MSYKAVLKRYKDDYFRLVIYKQNCAEITASNDKQTNIGKVSRDVTNESKEREYSSISRSRSKVFEIAIANDWNYWVTLTINGTKHARDNLRAYRKKLSKFLNNYNYKHNIKIAYILIPELHSDNKNFHIHGLLAGLPLEHLTQFTPKDKLPRKILKMLRDGREIYSWQAYAEKFGYITLETIQDNLRIAFYIAKYVRKGIKGTSAKIGAGNHLYYCSQGLKRATIEFQGELQKPIEMDYENEYIGLKTITSIEDGLSYFTNEDGELKGGIFDEKI
ncbi:MAG: hypothetical protein FWE04_06290 [Oscillospiraceae bacterium]|nr:hypothetical protein [Oscillospiraceae bacterium]